MANEPLDKLSIVLAGARRSELASAIVDAIEATDLGWIAGVCRGPMTQAGLVRTAPDLLIVAGYVHDPSRLRQIPRLASVGLHPSLLPAYRGSYPLWWALKDAKREVGLTLYHLAAAIDTGAIIDQRRVPVDCRDTFASLYARVAGLVTPTIDALLTQILREGALPPRYEQDDSRAFSVRTPRLHQRAIMKTRWATGRWS